MSTATQSDVTACSRAIGDAYVSLWRRWKPEIKVVITKRTGEIFERLAAILLANAINPYNYVRRTFEYYATMTGTVTADMLANSFSLKHYVEYQLDRDAELETAVRLQTNRFNDELARGRGIREIITDYQLPMSAVFRYAIAHSTGEHDLRDQLSVDAKQMLLFEPIYKRLLANLLPKEIVDD